MPRLRRRAAPAPTLSDDREDYSKPTLLAKEQRNQASVLTESMARSETRVVNILRVTVLLVLMSTAVLVSAVVYRYTRNEEHQNFVASYDQSALQVIDSFHEVVQRNMAAIASLSTSITSYAKDTNVTFPFVTVPDFELRGSDQRVSSSSHLIYYSPLVTNENRDKWEEYALQNRFLANSYERDAYFRTQQDIEYGFDSTVGQQEQYRATPPPNSNTNSNTNDTDTEKSGNKDDGRSLQGGATGFSMLDDGTNYHPKIWSPATRPLGDMADGSGPFLPVWQQSPVNAGIQGYLNLDSNTIRLVTPGLIKTMTEGKKALLNHAVVQPPNRRVYMDHILSLSQYRHDNLDGAIHTLITYPVFDSFEGNRTVVGILNTDIFWESLFSHLLSPAVNGIICVVENSLNQTFSFRLDGANATFLGMEDKRDPKYNDMAVNTNVNSQLDKRAGPKNSAYMTVRLSDTIQYSITVTPTQDTEDPFLTSQPIVYTIITVVVFMFAALVFLLYSTLVEHRQGVMTRKVVENVKRAAQTERELNEFLSHEIRNPLAAALSASTFVSTAVNESEPLKEADTLKSTREDMEVVMSSLTFINDFLRSMLDIYRVSGKKITVAMAPTDILQDILEPVSCILYKRLASYEVIVECPPNTIVMTDSIRLKQVILNLVRNASKFVERGFLRMRATVGSDNQVRIYIEDSGPGISAQKRLELFAKYQESLDSLSQGTGIGLNLSKKLMEIMKGDLYLDDTYDSGVEGCPGACFVVDLKTTVVELELELDVEKALGPGCKTIASRKKTEDGSTEGSEITDVPGSTIGGPAPSELPDGLSVLFVDDDVMLRKLFMRAVKRVAPPTWEIQDVSSGEMALKKCETQQFSIIFLDQYMASVDKQLLGTETAQAMRAKGVESIICGLSANDLRDAFINSGADDFILKPMPCKTDDLRQLLLKMLSTANDSTRGSL